MLPVHVWNFQGWSKGKVLQSFFPLHHGKEAQGHPTWTSSRCLTKQEAEAGRLYEVDGYVTWCNCSLKHICIDMSKKNMKKKWLPVTTGILWGWRVWKMMMDQLTTASMSKSWMRPTTDFPNLDAVYSSWVSGRNSWKPHSNGQSPRRWYIWRRFCRKMLLVVGDSRLKSKQLDVLTKTLAFRYYSDNFLGYNLS